jgi:hypothetical protein
MADNLYEDTRHQVQEMMASTVDEAGFEEVLDVIAARTRQDLSPILEEHEAGEPDAARELFDSIEAWASLASAVTYEMYVGPVREVGAARLSLPGWAKGVSQRLDDIVSLLKGYLEIAAQALGAPSFSIALTFPFGVSVGLAWS